MIPLKDDNPSLRPPILTVTLIALNVLVFIWQMTGNGLEQAERVFRYATVPGNLTGSAEDPVVQVVRDRPARIGQVRLSELGGRRDIRVVRQPIPPWLTLVTAMFLHGGVMHILGNMLFLWVFGNNIEDALGHLRFLVFYLAGGVAASFAHVLSDPGSMIPMIGASGAVSAVLGGYLLLYPKAHVLALVPIPPLFLTTLRLPAAVFLLIWFAMQITGVFGGGGNVAFWAHIGGFVVGLALVKLMETEEHRRRPPPVVVARTRPILRRSPFDRGF